MAEIFKFPYDASRRMHSRKPRRSKNGTPEERAAKAAALLPMPADICPHDGRSGASAFGG
jgi:predicted alpha/beta-hydrolase family hydrolase